MSTAPTNEPSPLERASGLRFIIAVLLSLLVAGAGHIVLGYVNRGFKWFASSIVTGALFVGAVLAGKPYLAWVVAATLVIIRLAGIVDTLRLRTMQTSLAHVKAAMLAIVILVLGDLAGEGATRLVRADFLPTESMYPTIEAGDHFVTSSVWSNVGRGELIVFDYPLDPSKRYVKRSIAIGGDRVEIRGEQIILNGKPVDRMPSEESCTLHNMNCKIWRETIDGKTYRTVLMDDDRYHVDPTARNFGPVVIPYGQVFVLGDNRDNSADSRYWGNVPVELIHVRPKFVYWSSSNSGIRWSRINQTLQ
jgi:signal peptidase I